MKVAKSRHLFSLVLCLHGIEPLRIWRRSRIQTSQTQKLKRQNQWIKNLMPKILRVRVLKKKWKRNQSQVKLRKPKKKNLRKTTKRQNRVMAKSKQSRLNQSSKKKKKRLWNNSSLSQRRERNIYIILSKSLTTQSEQHQSSTQS